MSELKHSVRPARSADLAGLTRTLAAAFTDDPLFTHLLPPGVRAREERIRRVFAVDGARSVAHGGLWTTDGGDAAAVWFPPAHWRGSPRQDLRELPAWLRIGGRRMQFFQRVRSALYAHHRELPPHWYLLYIGTRPERRGQRLGAALLQAMADRCDADGVPAYLEATCERSVPLYRRHGFAEHGTIDVPPGCPRMVPMWRDPR